MRYNVHAVHVRYNVHMLMAFEIPPLEYYFISITHSSSTFLFLVVNAELFYKGLFVLSVLFLHSAVYPEEVPVPLSCHGIRLKVFWFDNRWNKQRRSKKKKKSMIKVISDTGRSLLGPTVVTVFQKDLGKNVNMLGTVW